MKTVAKMALAPGMILGEDIVYQDNVIFPADTKLDALKIEKLNRYPIMCVTVMEDIDFASTHYEKIRFSENFRAFEQKYNECLLCYKSAVECFLQQGTEIEDSFFEDIFKSLYAYIPSGPVLLDYLYNLMPNEDELTYTHCLNSALLAGAVADWLSMSPQMKDTLILCCFYYDIGKLKLPYEILWKPGRLTEEEYRLVKTHPVLGYSLVRNTHLNEHVKNAVIMHHERIDGSGYPYHMSGAKIDVYARYIAIIDTYIAMASPRSYRSAMSPLQILGYFELNMDKYDVELLMPVIKKIANAQIGTKVCLSDDSIWEVLLFSQNNFSRPVLRNESSDILNLIEHPELEITKII